MSFVERLNTWWQSAHALVCAWFFVSKFISIATEIIGAASDIATVIVYFHAGNDVWGILSAVFVGLGWLVQIAGAPFMVADMSLTSKIFDRICSTPLGCLCGFLHLGVVLMHVDDFCAGVELYRDHGPEGVRKLGSDEIVSWTRHGGTRGANLKREILEKHSIAMLMVTVTKYAPNLMLHCYVLLVNQLDTKYAAHRVHGWGLVAQLVSTLFSTYCVSTALSAYYFCDEYGERHIMKRIVTTTVVFFDTVTSVLRVTVFAAAFHAWLALALGSWAIAMFIVYFRLSTYHFLLSDGSEFPDSVSARFESSFLNKLPVALVSPCIVFHFQSDGFRLPALDHRRDRRALLCLWESLVVTGVLVSLPFILTPHGTIFEHGMCSSLAEVTSTGNCIPRALLDCLVTFLGVNMVAQISSAAFGFITIEKGAGRGLAANSYAVALLQSGQDSWPQEKANAEVDIKDTLP